MKQVQECSTENSNVLTQAYSNMVASARKKDSEFSPARSAIMTDIGKSLIENKVVKNSFTFMVNP